MGVIMICLTRIRPIKGTEFEEGELWLCPFAYFIVCWHFCCQAFSAHLDNFSYPSVGKIKG